MQTLTQQVQTPLSLKQKTFSGFFIAFLKSIWNGELFQKKGESSSLSISEIIDSKRGVNKQSNILDLTKAEFFQLNLSQIHGKIG